MHISLRVLITLIAAIATVGIVIALGGRPGATTGMPGAVVAFITWRLTGRTRGAQTMIVFLARLLVALLSYSVFIFLWVLLKSMTAYEVPLILNSFVVACIGFASWEAGGRLLMKSKS